VDYIKEIENKEPEVPGWYFKVSLENGKRAPCLTQKMPSRRYIE